MEPVEDDPVQLRPQQALFYWPLGFALALSVFISGLPMLVQVTGGLRRAQ